MIPKKIWQTYKTDFNNLPDYASEAANTWIDKNPDWEYNYMSDEDMMDFVFDNFGKEWVDLFYSCRVPVMKADIWRLMILQIYGGLYTDIDTICNIPCSSWFNDISHYKMIVAAEHELHIEQWTLLSDKNNPILDNALINIKESLKDSNNYNYPNFVHHMTGAFMLTKTILEYLKLWEKVDTPPTGDVTYFQIDGAMSERSYHKINLIKDVEIINNSKSAKNAGFFIIPDYMFFQNKASTHIFGSINWNDGQYSQWLKHKEKIIKSNNC